MDRGAWRATVHGVAESDMTEQLTLSLIFVPDYWKNHSFYYMDLYWQNDVSAF